jgi:hypothetical protein
VGKFSAAVIDRIPGNIYAQQTLKRRALDHPICKRAYAASDFQNVALDILLKETERPFIVIIRFRHLRGGCEQAVIMIAFFHY